MKRSQRERRVLLKKESFEEFLERRNWEKQDMAQRCKIYPSTISHYLSHRRSVGKEVRSRMLKALGCQWDDLFFFESISAEAENSALEKTA